MEESIYWKPPHSFLIMFHVICLVTQKAKLSMRVGFSAIQCSWRPEREKVSEEVCDQL